MNFFDKNFNHILCLDDDDKLRKLISEYLQTNCFIVTQARNSNEATRMLKFYSFNLMILDIMMPGKSGLDFLKEATHLTIFSSKSKWILNYGTTYKYHSKLS